MAKTQHKTGLGKGLNDLFGIDTSEQEQAQGISTLPLTAIEPNEGQPRKVFDPEALAVLTDSIRKHGVITPITVRRMEGYYQIIAGERRWRAARAAGLTEIPALVLDVEDKTVMELALIENLQRQDLNPIEEAEGYAILIDNFGMTQEEVSERVGKSRPAVSNALRLLLLDKATQGLIVQGKLSGGHARAVLTIRNEDKRFEAAQQMEGLSVRAAENLAKKYNRAPKTPQKPETSGLEVDYLDALCQKLENKLGRKVVIAPNKQHGMLSLEYYGDDDLERLSHALTMLDI